jgi:hypothetical protein
MTAGSRTEFPRLSIRTYSTVMAGLVPAIHVLVLASKKNVDARDI